MLQEKILRTLEQRNDLDQRKLAQVAGVNESSISRYLNKNEELNFESVLKIVQYLYEDQKQEIMAQYAVTQKNQNARFALEYCVLTHLDETADQLIDTLQSSSNPTDREWANMYCLIRLRKKKELEYEELLLRLDSFSSPSIHMHVLKKIVKAYIYFDLNDHHSVSLQIKGTEELIGKIKSNFIRDCFNIRLGLIMNNVSLYRNHIEQARYYNSLVMNQQFFDSVKGLANLHLGHSFMFEEYDKAYKYLNDARDIFNKMNQRDYVSVAMRNISFLQSYWKVDYEFLLNLDNNQNIYNFIYYLIRKGDIISAEERLSQFDVGELSNWDKAFHYYYKGLIGDDKNDFYHSIKWFRDCGDFFHVQLPIQALHHLNENEIVLEMLSS